MKIKYTDIAEKDIFDFGKKFADSLAPAEKEITHLNDILSKHHNAIKQATITLKNLSQAYKTGGQKEFLANVEKESKLIEKSLQTKKQNIQLERELEKLKQEKARTEKTQIDLERKKQAQAKRNLQTIEEKEQQKHLNKLKRQEARENLQIVKAYGILNRKRTEAQKKLADLLATEQKDIKNQKQHQKLIKSAERQYQRLNKRIAEVDRATNNYTKNIGNYKSALSGLTGTFRSLMSAFGVAGGLYTFVNVLRNGVNTVREFGATMHTIAGVLDTTRSKLEPLENKIISVAGASIRTATEVGKLAESLVTMGVKGKDLENLIEPVNNLSIGLQASGDEAGEFLIQMLNTFGGSTEEAQKYADQMAKIRSSSSLTFQKMKDSFQYLAPISKALGKDMAYTGSLIGLLADNGIKAERAGRLLGTAQQKLAKDGMTLNDALNSLSKAKEKGASQNEILAISAELFGKQAGALGLILANNTKKIEENAESLRDAGGSLKTLTEEQLQSLDARFKILESRWEEFILNTDKSTGMSQKLGKALEWVTDNLELIVETIVNATKAFVVYKVVVWGLNKAYQLGTLAVNAYRIAKIALAGGIGKARRAMQLFNATMKANPIGLVTGLLATAYVAYKTFTSGAKDAAKAQKKINAEIQKGREAITKYNKELRKKTNAELKGIDKARNQVLLTSKTDEEKTKINKLYDQSKLSILEEKKANLERSIKTLKSQVDYYKKSKTTPEQEKYRDIVRDNLKQKLKLLEDYNEQIYNLQYGNDVKTKQLNEDAEKEKKERQKKHLQEAFELVKAQLEHEIKLQEKIKNDESKTYNERSEALQKWTELKKRLLDEIRDYESNEVNKISKTKQKTIDFKTKNQKKEVDETATIEQGKIYADKIKKHLDKREKQEALLNKRIKLVREAFRKGDISDLKEYQRQEKELRFYHQQEILQDQIKFLKEELTNNKNLTDEQRKLVDEELSNKQQQLENLNFDHDSQLDGKQDTGKSSEEEIAEYQQRLLRIRDEVMGQSANTIADALNIDAGNLNRFFDSVTNGFERAIEKANTFTDTFEKNIIKAQAFAEIASSALAVVSDIMQSNSEENIQAIDEEIEKSNEQYDARIKNLHDEYDENGQLLYDKKKLKEQLEKEKEQKEKELQAKKLKEKQKAFKFKQKMTTAEIAMNTAKAILGIWSDVPKGDFGISAGVMTAMVAALGAAQIAAVWSQKMPKYKFGRKGGKAEFAIVGDGGVQEVIERKKGGFEITPNKDTVTFLDEGDIVHKSIPDFLQTKNYKEVFATIQNHQMIQKAERFQKQAISFNEDKIIKVFESYQGTLKHEIRNGFQNINIHNNQNIIIDNDDFIR